MGRGYKRAGEDLDEETVSEAVSTVHRVADACTSLFFGADRDLAALEAERAAGEAGSGSSHSHSHSPPKRPRRSPTRVPTPVAELIERTRPAICGEETRTWSLGYGELTPGGFSKILTYMREGAPEVLRMTRESSFLDIGAGYGKAVFHVSAAVTFLRRCTGIECLPFRHARSLEVLHKLKEQGLLGSPVQLVLGDATQRDKFAHTHVFAFDYVFSDETQAALLPAVMRTRPKVYVSFTAPSHLRKLAGSKYKLVLLEKLRCRTTGGQVLTGYVYTHESHAKHLPAELLDKENAAEN